MNPNCPLHPLKSRWTPPPLPLKCVSVKSLPELTLRNFKGEGVVRIHLLTSSHLELFGGGSQDTVIFWYLEISGGGS